METVLDKNFTMALDADLTMVIENSWASYDRKKLSEGGDPCYFSCKTNWEVDYLVGKIGGIHPKYSECNSRKAIKMVCLASSIPAKREQFLEQVMGILQLL